MAIDHLREVLHVIAGLLMWPVMIGLVSFAVLTLYSVGAFAREAWDRNADRKPRLASAVKNLRDAVANDDGTDVDIRIEKALQDGERALWRSITLSRLSIRLGPALGLMGTLIPMAYALRGLSEGNMPALASNMVTAFAATVVGLAISVVSFLLVAAKEAWVRRDVQALAFEAEMLSRGPRAKSLAE